MKNYPVFPKTPHNPRVAASVAAILAAGAQLYAPPAAAAEIDEIVVTATRRSESVSDVPYNISAIGGAEIANAGITDLQGLTHMIPGLVGPDLGPRAGNINDTLIIRGLNASAVNAENQDIAAPAVSTYVDETPLFVNLKMTDIARVEVLRGPQGTLYGSGSLGGTVRMIHNEPDPTSTSFDVSTRASKTENAANPNEAVDFIGNLPISDTMAFRASGGYERLAGFTDALSVAVLGPGAQPVLADPSNPLTSPPVFTEHRGIDWSNTWYARAALLWKPTDALKLTWSYQHQTDQSGGYSQVQPGDRYDQTLYMDQPGSFQTDLGAFDVSYDAGFATVSSSSSYTNQSAFSQFDLPVSSNRLPRTTEIILVRCRRSSIISRTRPLRRKFASCRRTPGLGTGSPAPTTATASRRSTKSSRFWDLRVGASSRERVITPG